MTAPALDFSYPTPDELAAIDLPEITANGLPLGELVNLDALLGDVYRWGMVLGARLGPHVHESKRTESCQMFGRVAAVHGLTEAWDRVLGVFRRWMESETTWSPVAATQQDPTGASLELLDTIQRMACELMNERGVCPFGVARNEDGNFSLFLAPDDSSATVHLVVELFCRDRSSPGDAGTVIKHVESMFAIDMWAGPHDNVPTTDFLLIVHVRQDAPTQFYVLPYRLHEGAPAEFLDLDTQHARWIQKGAALVAAA